MTKDHERLSQITVRSHSQVDTICTNERPLLFVHSANHQSIKQSFAALVRGHDDVMLSELS